MGSLAHTPADAGGQRSRLGILLAVLLLPACSLIAPLPPDDSNAGVDSGAQTTAAAQPNVDDDTDGIKNSIDECDSTPMPQPVNDAGCPVFSGKLQGVEFRPDSYALDQAARDALDQLIGQLNEHPEVVLSVGGHTDNRGNARNNLELSKKRVLAVVRYLVINGIDGRRLQPHGYGESRPLFNNSTAEGRGRNRRIEITVIINASA